MRKIVFILLILLIAYPCWATTYTVCPSGCDYTTLSAAASGVPSGNHTISVSPGTYAGFTDLNNGPGSTPEVDSSYRIWLANGTVNVTTIITINGSWVKLDGFTMTASITQALTTTGTPNGSNCWFTNLTIANSQFGMTINGSNNLITNCDLSTIAEDYFHVYGSGHTFRGNYLHNHIHTGPDYHTDAWQTSEAGDGAAQNITIERNHVFMGIDATGVLSKGLDGGIGGIHVFMWEDNGTRKASGLVIRNNIFESLGGLNATYGHLDGLRIYNNLWRSDDDQDDGDSAPGILVYNSDDIEIKNNMFIDGTQGVGLYSVTNATNATNLFWRNDGGNTTNTNYSSTGDVVNQNPLFGSYNNDIYNLTTAYQLQSSSPARNAGTTIATVIDDYAGISRPQGAAYDIGAYEYVENIPTISGVTISGGSIR